MTSESSPLWAPSRESISRSHLRHLADQVERNVGLKTYDGETVNYDRLYQWSIEHPEQLWPELWQYFGIFGDSWEEVVVGLDRMAPPDPQLGPRWFLGARINFAENLLRYRDEQEALVSWNEQGRRGSITYRELHDQVIAVATALRAHGIKPGDRVAGFMPNIPEAMIAMLATASLGAIWSSCSPDFGVKGVLDRFGQIAPRVLFTADGYRYAGKEIDSLGRVKEIVEQIPAIERVVVVPYMHDQPIMAGIRDAMPWREWAAQVTSHESRFTRFAFDHPLYIMYSSGTTGLPKCMVHGAGGTLIQHMKEHQIHADLRREDRLFYFSTCGWMMWNWLASALATGATLILYDGAPLAPDPAILWDMAESERISVFGTSAKYIAAAEKAGLEPVKTHNVEHLRTILSTGSPLGPPGFDFVYEKIKRDVCLGSISGGTDIISCFAGGNPTGPVWRGELQALSLGMAVEVFDESGRPVRGEPGELVCTKPFPSMPVSFWNDPDGSKYRAAYFDHYPGVWRHGDWAEITEHGGMIITGRSDATLNPGGVRIGTAEIYRQVEQLPEIVESLVIGQDVGDEKDRDVRIVLFVRLREGAMLDDALRDRIRKQVRENASPHHVPKVIVQVTDIPRTISGKITEMAVRDVVHGKAVKNTDALANPQALELFRDLPELSR